MTGPARSTRLTREQLGSWRDFLRAYTEVTRRLEADLVAEHDLPLSWYDVLVQLVEAPGHRLRMTELADLVLISRSGLTRLVDRMVAEELVHREPAIDDARGMYAVLTNAGYDRLRAATPTHLRGVAAYVVDRVSPQELTAFGRVCAQIAEVTAQPGPE